MIPWPASSRPTPAGTGNDNRTSMATLARDKINNIPAGIYVYKSILQLDYQSNLVNEFNRIYFWLLE
jgi:hypothetical protein